MLSTRVMLKTFDAFNVPFRTLSLNSRIVSVNNRLKMSRKPLSGNCHNENLFYLIFSGHKLSNCIQCTLKWLLLSLAHCILSTTKTIKAELITMVTNKQ